MSSFNRSEDPDALNEGEEGGDLFYGDFFKASKEERNQRRREQHAQSVSHHTEKDNDRPLGEEVTEGVNGAEAEDSQEPRDLFREDENESQEMLSTHERKAQRMQESIKRLEQENMQEKGWQFTGEVNSSARPLNSLLEESLDFEHASKPTPVITEATTQSLEDLIKERILNVCGVE